MTIKMSILKLSV